MDVRHMRTSSLHEVTESPDVVAAASAYAVFSRQPVTVHIGGTPVTALVKWTRNNPDNPSELIVELEPDAIRAVTLYIPQNISEKVYAKVWPRGPSERRR